MAYIKERGNNNYFVRVSCGILDNGRPFQKSRLFRPSRVNLLHGSSRIHHGRDRGDIHKSRAKDQGGKKCLDQRLNYGYVAK